MKNILLLLGLLLLSSQSKAEDILQKLQSMVNIEPSVEVNLGAAMLGLLSGMTSEEEQVSNVMKNLTEIAVRVYDLDDEAFDGDLVQIKSFINATADEMKSLGMQQLAAIREDDSTVYIMAEMGTDKMQGLSVIALDDDSELVVIKIGGQIMMKDLAGLMNRFDVDLSDIDM
ncbi:DUF4252 domain-containing protein [Marinicella sp. S1101]|uniref:DUF4252 domain-containing protein n=1 Tax=Marinicella marina TaxID=2996016 RepID=UPI002260B7EC|nr:DUF4252 domain-containing protein [Marinicella marina]MCX7552415.1 DUF4252 domain-containing protein [Marinicella marina]MDJ1139290.1 DUF4252 domain-containing protein [Marinicella marina]